MPRTLLRDDQWSRIEGFCLEKRQIAVSQRQITAYLSKRFSGLFAQGLPGVICPQILDTGIECMFVTTTGLRKGYGSVFLPRCQMILILSI